MRVYAIARRTNNLTLKRTIVISLSSSLMLSETLVSQRVPNPFVLFERSLKMMKDGVNLFRTFFDDAHAHRPPAFRQVLKLDIYSKLTKKNTWNFASGYRPQFCTILFFKKQEWFIEHNINTAVARNGKGTLDKYLRLFYAEVKTKYCCKMEGCISRWWYLLQLLSWQCKR